MTEKIWTAHKKIISVDGALREITGEICGLSSDQCFPEQVKESPVGNASGRQMH